MYFDKWSKEAFKKVPQWVKCALYTVKNINVYKKSNERKFFNKNDFGFEQIILTYLADFFLSRLPQNYILGIGETLWSTKVKKKVKPDISLVDNNGNVHEVMEIKTILNNEFYWLKEDINKLRNLQEIQSKYILSVHLYLSPDTFKQAKEEATNCENSNNITLVHSEQILQINQSYVFYYHIFKV